MAHRRSLVGNAADCGRSRRTARETRHKDLREVRTPTRFGIPVPHPARPRWPDRYLSGTVRLTTIMILIAYPMTICNRDPGGIGRSRLRHRGRLRYWAPRFSPPAAAAAAAPRRFPPTRPCRRWPRSASRSSRTQRCRSRAGSRAPPATSPTTPSPASDGLSVPLGGPNMDLPGLPQRRR